MEGWGDFCYKEFLNGNAGYLFPNRLYGNGVSSHAIPVCIGQWGDRTAPPMGWLIRHRCSVTMILEKSLQYPILGDLLFLLLQARAKCLEFIFQEARRSWDTTHKSSQHQSLCVTSMGLFCTQSRIGESSCQQCAWVLPTSSVEQK